MAPVQCFSLLTFCQVLSIFLNKIHTEIVTKTSLDLCNILIHFYFCFQMKLPLKDILRSHVTQAVYENKVRIS